jgi:hypothetical protein
MSWGVLAVAVLTFLTSVVGYLSTRRKIAAVHVLVNSNLTKVMDRLGIEQDRTAQLRDSLKDAGVDVPEHP